MENEIANEFIYNYRCGAMKEVKIVILKDKTSFELSKPKIMNDFCPNGHQVILPVGKYQKTIGNELFYFS